MHEMRAIYVKGTFTLQFASFAVTVGRSKVEQRACDAVQENYCA